MGSHTGNTLILSAEYEQRLQTALQAGDSAVAKEAFERCYPHMMNMPQHDALRQSEYGRLDEEGQVYLDYTGGGLYAQSQIEAHRQQLLQHTFGNPHSVNPTSMAATHLVDSARDFVYEYFRASKEEYVTIFTSNASGALKLLGESYPFEQDGQYLIAFDNHNSVNGIREYATHHKAPVTYARITLPDLRMDDEDLRSHLAKAIPNGNNLFAFPAQSNFSGVKHPLTWIEEAQAQGWDVLLDAAAFVPTNVLDLSQWKPDFVSMSFYKMFGYPTGLGALIAKRDKLEKLRRPWFAGGTVEIVSAVLPSFVRAEAEAAFEDGTVDYLGIPAIEIGLRHLDSVGVENIGKRVEAFTGYLLDEMLKLKHKDGQPLVYLYGPNDTTSRGGTIAFNLLDPTGDMYDVRLVEALAAEAGISLRTGCFCNPGAGENAFHLTAEDVRACSVSDESLTYARYIAALTAHTHRTVTGAIRVSVGIATNFEDVYALVRFLHAFVDMPSPGFLA
jgi:molybdenum cofactor sulfurtransferase